MTKPLFKTTIVIWSEYDGSQISLEELAFQADQGDAYCSKQDSEWIKNPNADPDFDETEFFNDDSDDDEDEVVTGPPEILDPYISVFNCHINNASNRADLAFISAFGQDAWKEHIAPLHTTGIMAIFDSAPTDHTRFWVATVTNIVNEGKPDFTPMEV